MAGPAFRHIAVSPAAYWVAYLKVSIGAISPLTKLARTAKTRTKQDLEALGRVASYRLAFDEVKNGWMGGASAAKTFVLASEATLQTTIFHLTASRRGAFGR
jgi:hypothetical protein